MNLLQDLQTIGHFSFVLILKVSNSFIYDQGPISANDCAEIDNTVWPGIQPPPGDSLHL
jgi:hypothetical protein